MFRACVMHMCRACNTYIKCVEIQVQYVCSRCICSSYLIQLKHHTCVIGVKQLSMYTLEIINYSLKASVISQLSNCV